jgi:hypothetical protein
MSITTTRQLALSLLVAATAAFGAAACGKKFEKHPMTVGEVVIVKPMPVHEDHAGTAAAKAEHIRLVINIGGKELEPGDNVEIAFYAKEGDEKPLSVYDAKQLLSAYSTTDCDKERLQFLENAMLGDSLFCNGSLELHKVGFFVARRPGKDDKTATAALLEYDDAELSFASYSLNFY